jgi:hypothetical protein
MSPLSIIIVTHNAKAVVEECLRRLTQHYPTSELIVVDAESEDGTPEMLGLRFSKARLLRVANRGYAHAVNEGLRAASGSWIVVMNSDVYVQGGDLEALQQALEDHPRAVLAGPSLVTPRGRLQSFGPLYGPNYWNLRRPRSVAWISGALMMLRASMLEQLGPMDERFFFYNEDLEWCLRARRKHLGVLLVPRRVLHLGGASTPSDPRLLVEGYRGGLLITRLYYPWLAGFHRKLVWLEANLRATLNPSSQTRQAYRLLRQTLTNIKEP